MNLSWRLLALPTAASQEDKMKSLPLYPQGPLLGFTEQHPWAVFVKGPTMVKLETIRKS
ncbi:hypothetical protein I79_002309 [Cricetulus griseus]|uniref:Uncharacterized protein n=1 Tax=Cricetulus griseus TaxID=10029 RepID=G3GX22_CRIGR|nr:hypothetical protein I79_002309 [Cricetulus griseus]